MLFREPGKEYKADMAVESAADVAAGLTSFIDKPSTNPPTLNRDALEDKYGRASGRCRANLVFYLSVSNDHLVNADLSWDGRTLVGEPNGARVRFDQ